MIFYVYKSNFKHEPLNMFNVINNIHQEVILLRKYVQS